MMDLNELLAGLEERYDAVGHDLLVEGFTDDGNGGYIRCAKCDMDATVTLDLLGGWRVLHAGEDVSWVFDEGCFGIVSWDVLARLQSNVDAARDELTFRQGRLDAARIVSLTQSRQPA